jgi:hypothetical protein
MMRRRLLVGIVLGLLMAGCLPGGGEESSMDSMEADAALRQLIAETAKGSLGDREVTLDETSFGACDPAIPSEDVNLSIDGRVALREGERASELLPAVERYFEERDLDVEKRESDAPRVIGRTDDGLLVEAVASIGDEQLSLGGGSKCVENVQPRPRVPSDEFLSDPPSSP